MMPKGMDPMEAREMFAAINKKHRDRYVEEKTKLGKEKSPSWSVVEAVRQEWSKVCSVPYKPLQEQPPITKTVSGRPTKPLKADEE